MEEPLPKRSKRENKKAKNIDTIKLATNSKVEEIKSLASGVVKSKKQCNEVLILFQIIEDERAEEICLACIRAIHKIFCHFLDKNELQQLSRESCHAESSDVKIRQWLRERYAQSIDLLVDYLHHDSSTVKELALCTLMKYVEAEGKNPLQCPSTSKSQPHFPVKLFETVMKHLLSTDEDQEELIGRFNEYLEYDDVRYNYMKQMLQLIKTQEKAGVDAEDGSHELYLSNTLAGLLVLSLPSGHDKLCNLLVSVPTVSSVISTVKLQRQLYSKLWLAFVKSKLTSAMYKKILVSLPDKIIPHLHDPLIVSDWLISCYDNGGALSLMSLNGLFVLMTQYNLEYPAFYNKLYNIMGNDIFSAKYKARFFHMLDIFLQSLLLPTSTVAAFIKKLSRMSLTAPPAGALLIIELVINLLVRHDMCRTLVHRETPCDLDVDPYLPDEKDISECRAMESSLWEIKGLQKHWHHNVARQALRLEKALPATESALDDLLDVGYEQLMEKEVKKSKKVKAKEASGETTVPIVHVAPSKLLDWETGEFRDLWSIQEQ